ncbi:MAG: hypothetical protein R3213_02665, partial [Flavobacteriaceae bacterium]|nr:hypothetical protein [Flavobacteriaceae bacterium]
MNRIQYYLKIKAWNYFLVCSGLILFLYSCSVRKYIPEDKNLYTGAELKIVSDTIIKNEEDLKTVLEGVLQPEPNSKFLGMRPGLYFYYKNQKEKPGFINRWLYKQFGEEPVYQEDVEPLEVEELLINRLENRGFFYSNATSEVNFNEDARESSMDYTVYVEPPYRMETYQLDTLSPPIYKEIQDLVKTSKFFKGMRFDLSNFKIERQRMDNELKLRGYYNFNPTFLIFETDTNQYKNKRFDLYLSLKDQVPKKALKPYKINRINVYADYDLDKDPISKEGSVYDSIYYIQDQDPIYFKPKHLDPFITLQPGQLSTPLTSKNTSRRLSTL